MLLNPATAAAFPIAPPGTEGLLVVVGGNPVIATYQGNSASFSNDLYLLLDGSGQPGDDGNLANDLFIFNNQSSSVGATKTLGTFLLGSELTFRVHVNNTGFDYYTGPAKRNPDAQLHARVQQNFLQGESLVSFEDLFNTPEGPAGFNDLSFSFSNTTSARSIPEPASLLLLALGLPAAVARRRR
jgi:hypothetical protein